jgi:peptide/nickel transport system permease protein
VNAAFVGKKVLGSISTLIFVLIFNFFLFRIVQTDPVGSLFRGSRVPQAKLDELRVQFGLEDSLLRQFVLYLRETAQLNFGMSYQTRQPVWDEIQSKIWPTVLLVGVSAILSTLFGVVGGFIAAWRTTRSRRRRWSSTRCPTSGWACCSSSGSPSCCPGSRSAACPTSGPTQRVWRR